MSLTPGGKVDRSWGFEIIWANNEHYCGKLLVFGPAGSKTNMFMNQAKNKSWFVNAGKFKLTYIDIKTGNLQVAELSEGNTINLAKLSPHQLEALEDGSIIFEVGTADLEGDVFNLSPDASQTQPSEPQSNR